MHEINKVLSAAAWRLGVTNFFRGLVYAIAALLAGLIVTRLAQQLFGVTIAWPIVAYACAGAALVGAIVFAIVVRPNKAAVARRVDEGANLKESLSTALSVAKMEDPWARVTVESAVQKARGVRVSQAVPIGAPRFWPMVLALGLSLAVIWLAVPRMDVLGWHAKALAQQKAAAQFQQVKATAIDVKQLEQKFEKILPEKDKVDPIGADKPEPRTPEELRKQVLKDLTKLSERLDQLRNGEQGQKLDAIQQTLKNLKTPQGDSQLAKAMAKSDFKGAQKEIEKMKEAASASSMDDKAKKDMEEQLDNMAKQLSELAKNKQDLEQAMKNAGLDPKAAENQEAMKKALEAAKNLTPEQKQQLSEMAQAMSQCQSAMDKMSRACSQMSQCSKSGDKQGMSQAATEMQDQLSQLEQLQQEMQVAEAAKNECQSKMAGMCKGDKEGEAGQCNKQGQGECNGNKNGQGQGNGPNQPWSASWSQGQGNRRGGGGLGKGGSANSEQADFENVKRKDMGLKGDGPTISKRLVEGDSIKGESHADFVAAVTKAEQGATEDMEQNTIPREFHDAIKHYFGNLKGKAGMASDATPAAAPAPAKPAENAKDAGK